MTKFEALEAARLARGGRDTTQAASVPPPAQRERAIEPNGLRFRFTLPGERPVKRGSGFQSMTPERRREISAKANAARQAKVSAKRRSEIAAHANATRFGK